MSSPIVGSGGPTAQGSSTTGRMMQCPKITQYQDVRGISIPTAKVPKHFAVGLIHAAMRREWFGKQLDTSKGIWKYLRKAAKREAELQKQYVDGGDLAFAEALFGQYMKFWEQKKAPKVIAAELELSAPFGKGDARTLRTAKLDDLSHYVEAGGALCIGEAKTTSYNDVEPLIRKYEIHPQPLQYLAVYMRDPNGEAKYGPVAGVVLDITIKPEPGKDIKCERVFVEFRKKTIEDYIASARYFAVQSSLMKWDDDVRRTYQCTQMHGRMLVDCTYKDLCRFGVGGAGKYVLRDGTSLRKYKPKPGAMKMPWE